MAILNIFITFQNVDIFGKVFAILDMSSAHICHVVGVNRFLPTWADCCQVIKSSVRRPHLAVDISSFTDRFIAFHGEID